MILYIKNIFTILFLLIPFFLITGPAIPDIIISSGVIFGLFWLLVKEKRYDLFNDNFIKSGVLLWFGLLIISFFAIYKDKSFQDSLIFIRYLLIPICLYYLYFKNQKILNYFFIIVFILVIFVSLDTFYQFLNYTSEYGFGTDLFGFKSNWYGRLTGPFGDELIPGSYLSKFGLIGYMFILTNINLRKKTLVHTLYLSSILVICFLSGERMSFASFLLGLFVLLFF